MLYGNAAARWYGAGGAPAQEGAQTQGVSGWQVAPVLGGYIGDTARELNEKMHYIVKKEGSYVLEDDVAFLFDWHITTSRPLFARALGIDSPNSDQFAVGPTGRPIIKGFAFSAEAKKLIQERRKAMIAGLVEKGAARGAEAQKLRSQARDGAKKRADAAAIAAAAPGASPAVVESAKIAARELAEVEAQQRKEKQAEDSLRELDTKAQVAVDGAEQAKQELAAAEERAAATSKFRAAARAALMVAKTSGKNVQQAEADDAKALNDAAAANAKLLAAASAAKLAEDKAKATLDELAQVATGAAPAASAAPDASAPAAPASAAPASAAPASAAPASAAPAAPAVVSADVAGEPRHGLYVGRAIEYEAGIDQGRADRDLGVLEAVTSDPEVKARAVVDYWGVPLATLGVELSEAVPGKVPENPTNLEDLLAANAARSNENFRSVAHCIYNLSENQRVAQDQRIADVMALEKQLDRTNAILAALLAYLTANNAIYGQVVNSKYAADAFAAFQKQRVTVNERFGEEYVAKAAPPAEFRMTVDEYAKANPEDAAHASPALRARSPPRITTKVLEEYRRSAEENVRPGAAPEGRGNVSGSGRLQSPYGAWTARSVGAARPW